MADSERHTDISRRGVLRALGGAAAAATAGVSLAQSSGSAGEPVALQYFHEDWQTITNDLDRVGSLGFDAIWIQQPAESILDWPDQGGRNDPPLGYQPIDYTNFDSSFGTESELKTLIETAHSNSVDVIVDTVMNHTANADASTFPQFGDSNFHNQGEIPQWSYSFTNDDGRCYVDGDTSGTPKDPDEYECDPGLVENAQLLGLRDLDQDQAYVREKLKAYVDKIASLGADGYRFDAAKHMDESFFADYANQWAEDNGMFRVGEVYDGNPRYLRGYANAGPGMHVFDFSLYYTMQGVFNGGDMSNLEGAGLISTDPLKAMPFVENHDVDAPSQYELAHAFMLSSEGYPMLYNLYPDELLSNDNIMNAVWVKKNLAGGDTLWRYTDSDVAVFERESNLLVGLNNGSSSRTVTVDTSWGSQELKDYAGNQPNVTTAGDGTVEITIPAGGWVYYAIPGQGDSSSGYTVSNLSHPSSASAGDVITVSADITNDGDEDGTATIDFNVDGATEASTDVSLAAGSSTSVSFDYDTSGSSGSLSVGIVSPDDSQSGTVDITGGDITLEVDATVGEGESVYFTGSPDALTGWGTGVEGSKSNGVWQVTVDDPGTFEWKTRRGPAGDAGAIWEDGGDHTDTNTSPAHQGWEQTPPSVAFSTSPSSPSADEQVTFDGSASTSGEGSIQSYDWSFSDGSTASGEQVTHTFSSSGSYDATLDLSASLTLTDDTTTSYDLSTTTTIDVSAASGVVDQYDQDDDGTIDIGELNTGMSDYFTGDVSINQLNTLIDAYFDSL